MHSHAVNKKKNGKKKKIIIFTCIGAVIIGGLVFRKVKGTKDTVTYSEETAEVRDIQNYTGYTGTVQAVQSVDVIPSVAAGVKQVLVNVGDTVKKGDVLMYLDSYAIQLEIDKLKAGMDAAAVSRNADILSAQTAYNNCKEAIDKGLNSDINSAKAAVDTAEADMKQKEEAYETEKKLKNFNISDSTASARDALTSAYQAVLTAETEYTEARNAALAAKKKVSDAQADYNAAGSAVSTSYAAKLYDRYLSAEQALESAKEAYEAAEKALSDNTDETKKEELTAALSKARSALASAQAEYDRADQDYTSAKSEMSTSSESVNTAKDSLDSAKSSYQDSIAAETKAKQSLDSAWAAYNKAAADAESAAKKAGIAEDKALSDSCYEMLSAQRTYLQNRQSYDTAVLTANQQLETYRAAVITAQAENSQGENQVTLKDLERQLDECTVKAPIDGVVTALNLPAGSAAGGSTSASSDSSSASAGTAGAAATITSFDRMKVHIKCGEYDLAGIHEGDEVTAVISALGSEMSGKVTHIDRTGTQEEGVTYYGVDVEIPSAEDIRTGMSAEIRVIGEEAKDAVSVSAGAVQTDENGETYVLVKEDGKQKKVSVTAGVSDGTYTEITEGLSEGDTVMVPDTALTYDVPEETADPYGEEYAY